MEFIQISCQFFSSGILFWQSFAEQLPVVVVVTELFLTLFRMIVDKIDKNRDGFVSEKELEEWVRHVASR